MYAPFAHNTRPKTLIFSFWDSALNVTIVGTSLITSWITRYAFVCTASVSLLWQTWFILNSRSKTCAILWSTIFFSLNRIVEWMLKNPKIRTWPLCSLYFAHPNEIIINYISDHEHSKTEDCLKKYVLIFMNEYNIIIFASNNWTKKWHSKKNLRERIYTLFRKTNKHFMILCFLFLFSKTSVWGFTEFLK